MALLRTTSFDFLNTHHSLTFHLGWATIVASLGTFQFGYHLSELNAASSILSCNFHRKGPYESYEDTLWFKYGLKQCIPLEQSHTTIITTFFTIGGLISSIIIASNYFHLIGRKASCIVSALLYMIGSMMMALSNTFATMNGGRFLCGLGAGLSVVISPILINELTPINHRGFLGSFLQVALAFGILSSQLVSIPTANDQQWRWIFLFAALIGCIQFILLFTIVESPKWLVINKNDTNNATNILSSLRSNQLTIPHEISHWKRLSVSKYEIMETTPLIEDLSLDFQPLTPTKSRRGSIDPSNISIIEFLTKKIYKRELIALILIMSGNQLCGMNAITFYGVLFLKQIVPPTTNILYLTSALGLCNLIGALIATPLFDRVGRKKLLLLSCLSMSITSLGISLGLINHLETIVAISCFAFIISFCIGMGPIVYLMVPEFTSHNAIGIAQSFGTTINWISNMCIAYWFPYLDNWLNGYVFMIFTVINLFYMVMVLWFVPETKDLSNHDDVWRNFRLI